MNNKDIQALMYLLEYKQGKHNLTIIHNVYYNIYGSYKNAVITLMDHDTLSVSDIENVINDYYNIKE
jgi:hypothetical protein